MIVRPADGRICDIISHAQAGRLDTARNLAANTPGIDWAQRLPPAIYAALVGAPAPVSESEETMQEVMAL